MMISIDTNVLLSIWDPADPSRQKIAEALDERRVGAELLISGFVYAELRPSQEIASRLDGALRLLQITIDWEMDETIFRLAGEAFHSYVERRRTHSKKRLSKDQPRRLMTDFLIGAHASVRGCTVATRDMGIFRAAFPQVKLIRL